jgi:guanylate kinase
LDCAETYDYLIINDELEAAVDSLKSIIIAERSRRRRLPTGEPMRWSR